MKPTVAKSATPDVALSDLRLLAQAIALGGLAAVARASTQSKASVTRQLQRLEAAVGQRLLHRGAGRFALTEEGRELLLKVSESVAAIDDALNGLVDPSRALEGRLRVTAPTTFGRTVVAPTLPGFMARYPAVSIELELSSRRVDLLADEADVAIRVGDPGSEQLAARRLARDRVLLCASPKYLSGRAPLRSLSDLAHHDLLDFRLARANGSVELFDAAGKSQRIHPARLALWSNDPEVLATAARHDAGVALVPEMFVHADLKASRLIEVVPGAGLPTQDINALYVPGRRHSPKIRAFLDYVAERLGA